MTALELWAWGANNYGQLGVGAECEQVETPVRVPLPSELRGQKFEVSGGGGHSALTDGDGSVWMCGWNNKGQLGVGGKANCNAFTKVASLPEAVTAVSCGWDFTFVLGRSGRVYGSGSNAFGQLGLPASTAHIETFTLIPGVERIVSVSCGM